MQPAYLPPHSQQQDRLRFPVPPPAVPAGPSLNAAPWQRDGVFPQLLGDLEAPKRNSPGPLPCCPGCSLRCRQVTERLGEHPVQASHPGLQTGAPARTLRHTPRPPAKHGNMTRGERRGPGRPSSLGGLADRKQAPVHRVRGDPCTLPVTKPQLRRVGTAAVRGRTAALGGGVAGGPPAWKEVPDPRPSRPGKRALSGLTHTQRPGAG